MAFTRSAVRSRSAPPINPLAGKRKFPKCSPDQPLTPLYAYGNAQADKGLRPAVRAEIEFPGHSLMNGIGQAGARRNELVKPCEAFPDRTS
jgi:hypothetical protein